MHKKLLGGRAPPKPTATARSYI